MNERLHVRLHRVPLPGVDVHLVREIRDAMLADLVGRIEQEGQVPESLRFLSTGLVEEARLSEMSQEQPEQIAAFFRGAAARKGVVRSFRVGAATVEGERVAALLELGPQGAWWAVWCGLEPHESPAVLRGQWKASQGGSLASLLPELRSWVDSGALQVNDVAARWLRRDVPRPPSIAVAEVPLEQPISGEPLDIVRSLGPVVDAQVLDKGLPGVVVLVYRDRVLERWDVVGELPCSIDDLVRAACDGVLPDAAAVIYGAEVSLDEQRLPGVVMVVEHNGARARRVLPLETQQGGVRPRPARYRDLGAVGPGSGWIGVAPESGMELVALAAPLVAPEG